MQTDKNRREAGLCAMWCCESLAVVLHALQALEHCDQRLLQLCHPRRCLTLYNTAVLSTRTPPPPHRTSSSSMLCTTPHCCASAAFSNSICRATGDSDTGVPVGGLGLSGAHSAVLCC